MTYRLPYQQKLKQNIIIVKHLFVCTDTAPELHYTFIEQALHPGPALALHCAASGAPPPRFTWLLDGQPIEELNTPQRSDPPTLLNMSFTVLSSNQKKTVLRTAL